MDAYEKSLKELDFWSELVKLGVIMQRELDQGNTTVERDYVLGKIDQVLGGSPIQLDPECRALFNQRMGQ